MTLIALVRHGQTDWNLQRRIQGSTDIPLNDTGRAQARETAERLREVGITRVVSSPLSRAAETADIVAATLGLPVPERIAELVERGYGSAEGMEAAEFAARFSDGVPDAEAEEDVIARVRAALHDLATRFPDDRIAAASHGGVIGRLLRAVDHGDMPTSEFRVVNGSIWLFEVTGDDIEFLDAMPSLRPDEAEAWKHAERIA